MNTYQISYDDRRYGTVQSIDIQVRAQKYADYGDTLTLFNTSPNGEIIRVAAFKNWHSIIDISVVEE